MTIQHVVRVLYDQTITDQGDLLVMMAIADEAGEDGRARPRVKDIMSKARCEERTVQRKIKSLVSSKKLQVISRFGTSNEYHLYPGYPQDSASYPQDVHPTPVNLTPPPPSDWRPLGAKLTPHTNSVLNTDSNNKETLRTNPITATAPGKSVDNLPLDQIRTEFEIDGVRVPVITSDSLPDDVVALVSSGSSETGTLPARLRARMRRVLGINL